jgi:hypothetical protein
MPRPRVKYKDHRRERREEERRRIKNGRDTHGEFVGLVYMCEQKQTKSHGRVQWNDEYAPAIQCRPFMGFPGKKREKDKTKTLSGPRRHDTWDLERQ